ILYTSRRRHTTSKRDWSSDVCSSDLGEAAEESELFSALHALGLEDQWQRPTKALSQGQKRRIALARLWCTRKSLWLLDEPLAARSEERRVGKDRRALTRRSSTKR